jgi:GNAT superfamily N-acetyltransferase
MSALVRVVELEPSDCDEKVLGDFKAFVLAGGEVTAEGLEDRIRSAVRLIFLSVCCCLCGVAALKRPEPSHRKHVSSKSGVSLPEAEYPFELGWVFVMPSARGRRFSLDLTRAALAAAGTAGVFATSRTDNTKMHATLAKFGFSPAGCPYPSALGSHQLQLFVRRADQQSLPADAGHR